MNNITTLKNDTWAKHRPLINAIKESIIFKTYQKAYRQLTGLPLSLHEADSWHLPHQGVINENPFCAAIHRQNRSCASCLEMKAKLYHRVGSVSPVTQTALCHFGVTETAIPLKLGSEIIAYLHTGQIFLKKPQPRQFKKMWKNLLSWNFKETKKQLEKVYFNTRVIEPKHYKSIVAMLGIFARHIEVIANQITVQHNNSESTVVIQAKTFIQEHQTEDLSLGEVAKSLHMSSFYLCKIFKKSAGITFTDYLSRIRIESGKNLLLNPNFRVTEIAYEIGFQSLTNFNRVFKKFVGHSPTQYRSQLAFMR